jgi:phage tail-like protein
MTVGKRKDPYLGFNFLVEVDGIVVGGFSEISGIQMEIEVHDYREGGRNEYIHKLPGPTRYPSNLIFKRGITDSDLLWIWHEFVTFGIVVRFNGSILLLDAAGQEKWRWNFFDAYPVKWIGPQLRADSNSVAVETLELVHRGILKA